MASSLSWITVAVNRICPHPEPNLQAQIAGNAFSRSRAIQNRLSVPATKANSTARPESQPFPAHLELPNPNDIVIELRIALLGQSNLALRFSQNGNQRGTQTTSIIT